MDSDRVYKGFDLKNRVCTMVALGRKADVMRRILMIARADARHLQLSPKVGKVFSKVSSSASGSAWIIPSLLYQRNINIY